MIARLKELPPGLHQGDRAPRRTSAPPPRGQPSSKSSRNTSSPTTTTSTSSMSIRRRSAWQPHPHPRDNHPVDQPCKNESSGFSALFQSLRYNRAVDPSRAPRPYSPSRQGAESSGALLGREIKAAKMDEPPLYCAQNTARVMREGDVLLRYDKRMNGSEISEADFAHSPPATVRHTRSLTSCPRSAGSSRSPISPSRPAS